MKLCHYVFSLALPFLSVALLPVTSRCQLKDKWPDGSKEQTQFYNDALVLCTDTIRKVLTHRGIPANSTIVDVELLATCIVNNWLTTPPTTPEHDKFRSLVEQDLWRGMATVYARAVAQHTATKVLAALDKYPGRLLVFDSSLLEVLPAPADDDDFAINRLGAAVQELRRRDPSLPEKYLHTVQLQQNGKSITEIAKQLGVCPKTVRNRLAKSGSGPQRKEQLGTNEVAGRRPRAEFINSMVASINFVTALNPYRPGARDYLGRVIAWEPGVWAHNPHMQQIRDRVLDELIVDLCSQDFRGLPYNIQSQLISRMTDDTKSIMAEAPQLVPSIRDLLLCSIKSPEFEGALWLVNRPRAVTVPALPKLSTPIRPFPRK